MFSRKEEFLQKLIHLIVLMLKIKRTLIVYKSRGTMQQTTLQIKHKKEVVDLTRKNRHLLEVQVVFT